MRQEGSYFFKTTYSCDLNVCINLNETTTAKIIVTMLLLPKLEKIPFPSGHLLF